MLDHRKVPKEIEENYYKAYEERYKQVYKKGFLWSSTMNSYDVVKTIYKEEINKKMKILEIGCGEGRDAIYLLNKGYNVLAIDYSKTVIEKCNELSNFMYKENFMQFDVLCDKLNDTFDFIYSVAVIHMFISKKHRNLYYQFIYEYLNDNSLALIITMGDGKIKYTSNINEAFTNKKRIILNNNKKIKVKGTSCKIVDWQELEEELSNNKLIIKRKWITEKIEEFDKMMCVLVEKEEK